MFGNACIKGILTDKTTNTVPTPFSQDKSMKSYELTMRHL